MSDPNKIVGLVKTQGTTRVYQMEDGSQETREGGTVSWRNNNPGNLKFEYAGSADKTVASKRSPEAALTAAQGRYSGVVALDQWGNAIFETESAGRAAKAQLLKGSHGERTVPEMLGRYAKDDYTGKANTAAYANSVYAEGDRQGVDLRGKKINDLSTKEFGALLDGMKKVEGFQEGTVTRTPVNTTGLLESPASPAQKQPALNPEQQRVHQLAMARLGTSLTSHSAEQLDTLARNTALIATENAGRGNVQGVFLSKDQQTIGLKHEFGITEVNVNDAMNRNPGVPTPTHAAAPGFQPATELQAAQMAGMNR